MRNRIEPQIEEMLCLRKQLAELESRRIRQKPANNSELWQDFMHVSLRLEQAEGDLRQSCRQLFEEVSLLRGELEQRLQRYNSLREQAKEIEEQFLLNIAYPRQHWEAAIRVCETLEKEYRRMQRGIQRGAYLDLPALQGDIRKVLLSTDTQLAQDESQPNSIEDDAITFLEQVEDLLEEDSGDGVSFEQLAREFRRVVWPATHPDTSDTPIEVFNQVNEVFQRQDAVLMEAYIVQYSPQTEFDPQADLLDSADELLAAWKRCQRVSSQLQRRVRVLEELLEQKIEDLAWLQQKMQQRREQFMEKIRIQAEQILAWREKIEGLTEEYLDWYGRQEKDNE